MKDTDNETRKIRAVLFDLDGTLIDTEGQYSEVWGRIGRQYHPEMEDFAAHIKGLTLQRILDTWFAEQATREKVVEELYAFERGMYFDFYPGAREFVAALRSGGTKCAVVTSSDRSKMDAMRRKVSDLDNLFDAIFTAEDFHRGKPDPDCYITAAEAMECDREECVVVEDAPNGLEAGRNSGMFTIGKAGTLTLEQLLPLCDYAFSDYGELTPELLQRIKDSNTQRHGKK